MLRGRQAEAVERLLEEARAATELPSRRVLGGDGDELLDERPHRLPTIVEPASEPVLRRRHSRLSIEPRGPSGLQGRRRGGRLGRLGGRRHRHGRAHEPEVGESAITARAAPTRKARESPSVNTSGPVFGPPCETV